VFFSLLLSSLFSLPKNQVEAEFGFTLRAIIGGLTWSQPEPL
jgi:hypothetical protein